MQTLHGWRHAENKQTCFALSGDVTIYCTNALKTTQSGNVRIRQCICKFLIWHFWSDVTPCLIRVQACNFVRSPCKYTKLKPDITSKKTCSDMSGGWRHAEPYITQMYWKQLKLSVREMLEFDNVSVDFLQISHLAFFGVTSHPAWYVFRHVILIDSYIKLVKI